MGVAIVVLAGQSNANRISNEVEDALIERYGANGYVLVESHVSGAPLTRNAPNKDDWATDSELPSQLVSNLKKAVAENPGGYSGGLIWVQGEADTWASANPDVYRQRLEDLIEHVSTEVSSEPGFAASTFANLKVAISQLADMAPEAATRDTWSDIIVAQKKVARFSDNITSVDPDDLAEALNFSQNAMFDDPLHYSSNFSKVLADRLVVRVSDMSAENQVEPPIDAAQGLWLQGTNADNEIISEAGNDVIKGVGGDDILHGKSGNDKIHGGNGYDEIRGNRGSDILLGNNGSDNLRGGRGDDNLKGGNGDDSLFGGNGADVVNGGAGNDVLKGGVVGDQGDGFQDKFVFRSSELGEGGFDRVRDFEDNLDILDLSSFGFANFSTDVLARASDTTSGMRINFGSGDVLFIEGFEVANFDAGDVLL